MLTHGEPHPGNVMRVGAGWRLVDWDIKDLAYDVARLGAAQRAHPASGPVAARPR